MRLFIAIETPRTVKKELERLQDELKSRSSGGRYVSAENMHITLSFLGECDNTDLAELTLAMRAAVSGLRPFALHLGKYSCFERAGTMTAYCDIAGNVRELGLMHESLTAALRERGFKTEYKRYVPHITLARGVVHDDAALQELRELTPPVDAVMSVNELVLFESVRTQKGMKYLPIHRERL